MCKQILLLVAFAAIFSISIAVSADQNNEAASDFDLMIKQIEEKSKSLDQQSLAAMVEKKMKGFMKKYPGTQEAAKADLILGQFYMQMARSQEAVIHLEKFLGTDFFKGGRERQMAKVSLGDCYLQLDKFDEAEDIYNQLLKGGHLDEKMRNVVRGKFSRIGTLRKLAIGNPAIEFSAESVSGEEVSLKDLRGKVVLLDFWASWCRPCIKEMPNVKRIYREYHDDGFEIIGISLDNNKSRFKNYVSQENISWPQIYDGKGWMSEVAQLYAVSAIPATFLIDREGKIAEKNVRSEALEKAVRTLVEEK